MSTEAYQRGVALAEYLIAARAAGADPDIRWDLADEAKTRRDGSFAEVMQGLNETLAKEEEK